MEGISHQTVAHGVQAGQPRLTNTFASDRESSFMKAGYGKTVRPVCAADGGKLFIGRLLRPDSVEAGQCPWSEGSRLSALTRVNRQREEPAGQGKAAAFVRWYEPDRSRG